MDKKHYADSQLEHPSPHEFDKFLPWACNQLSVEANIIITRKIQKQYQGPVVRERSKFKKSKSRAMSLTKSDSDLASDDLSAATFAKSLMLLEKTIFIEAVYDAHLNLVQIKFLKNCSIPRMVMKIIGLIISFHKHLTSITINSGLQMEAMYEMSKFLPISRITEMCLDNTFLVKANYHLLLDKNSLKHLSIAKCKINDDVVKTIASKLEFPCPASTKLSILNLATNRITDLGVKYLADALRTNRQLSYLNLSDNRISDKGAICLFDSLVEFPLTEAELAAAKARYLIYLKTKHSLIQSLVKSLKGGEVDKKTVKKKLIRSAATPLLTKNRMLEKVVPLTKDRTNSATIYDELHRGRAHSMAKIKMDSFHDPFSPSNTVNKGDEMYCFGNNSLCYLNLAYNNISYLGLKKLHEVLVKQKLLCRIPRGLVNVIIEGNFLPVACKEFQEIDDLLASGHDRRRD